MKMTGKVQFDQVLDKLKGQQLNIARGAARAGAAVIADEWRNLCNDPEVKASIGVGARSEPGIATGLARAKGPGAYRAPWGEFGTDPHFISVDDSQSGGRTVRRVNKLAREGSLVINGKFVGDTVHHPGAKPHPALRPAVEHKRGAALDAAAAYIRKRFTKEGLDLTDAGDDA